VLFAFPPTDIKFLRVLVTTFGLVCSLNPCDRSEMKGIDDVKRVVACLAPPVWFVRPNQSPTENGPALSLRFRWAPPLGGFDSPHENVSPASLAVLVTTRPLLLCLPWFFFWHGYWQGRYPAFSSPPYLYIVPELSLRTCATRVSLRSLVKFFFSYPRPCGMFIEECPPAGLDLLFLVFFCFSFGSRFFPSCV